MHCAWIVGQIVVASTTFVKATHIVQLHLSHSISLNAFYSFAFIFFSSLWCSFSEPGSHFSSEIAPSVRAPMEFSRLFRRSCNKQRFRFKNSAENGQLPYLSSNTYLWGIDPSIPYTIETGYKTPFCPRENLSYMRLFPIWHDLVGRKNCLITELFLYGSFISGLYCIPF